MYITSLPYNEPAIDFSPFSSERGSVFLDSSLVQAPYGRYSYWAINPVQLFESRGGEITVDGHTTIDSPASALKNFYAPLAELPADPYIPFSGGLIGFLGYEWGAGLENIEPAGKENLYIPEAWFGFFDTVVCYDHLEQSCRVFSHHSQEKIESLAQQIIAHRKFSPDPGAKRQNRQTQTNQEIKCSLTEEAYLKGAQRALDYLKAGDCYQVNLSLCFMAPTARTSWNLYSSLRKISPAPYAAFINAGSFQILSSSPELFLEARADRTLTTRPIKGTRRRDPDPAKDQALKEELSHHPKDNAELLMITDLERNDLGKICEPGSVWVSDLKSVESYAQVHHLVSTVQGKRKSDYDLVDSLSAMLPGGSITGAPKIRAMEIIRELEPLPRNIYTGSIGWLGPANTGHLNIAIRTMVVQDSNVFFHAGSGIVIDSDPKKEYDEILVKAFGMMQALEGS